LGGRGACGRGVASARRARRRSSGGSRPPLAGVVGFRHRTRRAPGSREPRASGRLRRDPGHPNPSCISTPSLAICPPPPLVPNRVAPMVRRGLMLCAVLAAAPAGCTSAPRGACQTTNMLPVTELVDRDRVDDAVPAVDVALCEALAAGVSRPTAPADPTARRFNVLVLSGGGAYGAYPAGILCGWTEAGTRPGFDVVTGVSTGALVATLAFLGPSRDADLRRVYTTVTSKDVFEERRPEVAGVLGESLADSKPLERLINSVADERLLAEVAAEHAKGRRLYVGTTHLDSRRLIVWDMGAIATRGGPVYLTLFRKVLLASASIPGFFPPVRVPVEVDGKAYEELHVDGGVTAALFFRPPVVPPGQVAALGDHPLAGSNLYVIVAGKLF